MKAKLNTDIPLHEQLYQRILQDKVITSKLAELEPEESAKLLFVIGCSTAAGIMISLAELPDSLANAGIGKFIKELSTATDKHLEDHRI